MTATNSATTAKTFAWPHGKRVAVSLSFDDARRSQIDRGMEILNRHNVKGTFYITVATADKKLADWKDALARGHEIGNHTICHPCSGNFSWSRHNALEDMTLEKMEAELTGASQQIEERYGIKPQTFAYPCGQTFVGRGVNLKSYVPLVAKHFLAGRGFLGEVHNSPTFSDTALLSGFDFDCQSFETVKARIEAAAVEGGWAVFAGHEIADGGGQVVPVDVLDKVCRYCQDPANGVWIDTVANVARHVTQFRQA